VEMGASVGPLRRTKRLRMVRRVNEAERIVFQRRETDGSSDHEWLLTVDLVPDEPELRTNVNVALHYGGTLPPLVDRILAVEVGRAGPRLVRLVSAVG